MNKILLILICLFFAINLHCQNLKSFASQKNFAEYLLKTKMYSDLYTLLSSCIYSSSERDTINFLLGKSFYLQSNPDSSSKYLSQINDTSSLFKLALPLQIYNYAQLKKYKKADSLAHIALASNIPEVSFTEIQYAGVSLLKRDTAAYNKIRKISANNFSKYDAIYSDINKFNQKSKVVAGTLSALVPGLGKVYAGQPKQGLAAFISVILFGAVAGEALYKGGASHPLFIGTASIFSLFYIGNIWGSVLSVSIRRNEFNSKINDTILVNMSVPFSRLFK